MIPALGSVDLWHADRALVDAIPPLAQSNGRAGSRRDAAGHDPQFRSHNLLGNEPFRARDAAADDRLASKPLVPPDRHIRVHSGAKLSTSDGHRDRSVESTWFSEAVAQAEARRALSPQVINQMERTRKALH
jgi:hypothetical protein